MGSVPERSPSSPDQRRQPQPPADIQGPDALGSVDLVPAHRQGVHPQLLRGEGDLQKALDRVTVEQGGAAGRTDGAGGLGHREDGAQLVVHQHHGHQDGVRAQGRLHLLCRDDPLLVRLEPGDLIALPFQLPDGLQHRGVFDGGGDDVFSFPPVLLHCGGNGPVVPLSAAGEEVHFLRAAAQAGGHLCPMLLQPSRRLLAEGVPGGWVAPLLRHGGHSRLSGLRPGLCGGGIVQIVKHSSDFPLTIKYFS